MPAFLDHFEIDWGWPRLSDWERAVVRRHEARAQADPATHTLDTVKDVLATASRELRGRTIRSRAEDEYGEHTLEACEGRCSDAGGESFDEEGRFHEALTAEDYRAAGVQKLYVALYWPEAMLEAPRREAHRLDRSLSWVVQRGWFIARDCAPDTMGDNELPRDGQRRKQSIYIPTDIYAELTHIAAREDRSMSFIVQRALGAAWATITTMPTQSIWT